MRSRRFYVPAETIEGDWARLPAEEVHHLTRVLRLGAGAVVEIFDGTGRAYRGVVAGHEPDLRVEALQVIDIAAEPALELRLGLALIKPARFEWVLEKATELGVAEVVPLRTRFAEIRIPEAKLPARLERWERIARGAVKQCRRASVPRLRRPIGLEAFLAEAAAAGPVLLFAERGGAPPESGLMGRRLSVVIGPEGGWHDSEIEAARSAGCRIVSLGPRILRADTAAVAALAIVQFQLGDLA